MRLDMLSGLLIKSMTLTEGITLLNSSLFISNACKADSPLENVSTMKVLFDSRPLFTVDKMSFSSSTNIILIGELRRVDFGIKVSKKCLAAIFKVNGYM